MTLNQKTRRLTPVVVVTAVLALSGCFADTSSDIPGMPAVGSGDRIRVAMLQPPRSGLSPFTDDAFKLSRWSTAETLVVLDDEANAEPRLATSWRQVDPLTWRFQLRDGVTYHDGTSMTSATIVNALQKAVAASPKPRILDGVELSVRATGPLEVEVRTAVTDPLLPQRLSSPQLAMLAEAAYDADGTVSPVNTGTGPYVLVDVNGTSTARLERYDDYWGETAEADGIDVAYVPDGTARGAALRTSSADIVEAIPVSQAPLLDEDLVHEVPMPRTNTLYLNNARGPFRDQRLRAAAREAVDARSIVETVYEGRADLAVGLLGPAVPWAADLRQDGTSTVRPAKPTGQKITLGTFSDRAELPEVAVQVEQQLERAGFEVEQDVREYANFEPAMLDGAFDVVILSRATVLDSGDPVAYLYSDFACRGSFNISQVCDEEIDRTISAASVLPVGPERRAAVMAAEAAVLRRDVVVPLLHEKVVQGEAAGVRDAARDPRERELVLPETHVEDPR